MGSNLIQNFITGKQQVSAYQQTPVKPRPDFDIQRELDNRTFIKPLRGKGRLKSGNIFMSPKYAFDEFIYSVKAFKHAAKGEANDHELGKLNDVGLLAGGLSIAGYLTTKRYTPMTKGMEFVGLGSFLASMALWPKVAIQLPAYLIHGVNVRKEYEDSFGRTKPFYQDPQFIPWDLYTDEQIDKIGDRLGVPKDIENRRDFVQERMRKLAVQNNTLWMMTAGFATPVMSALICNALEPHLASFLNNKRNKEADDLLAHMEKNSKKFHTDTTKNKIDKIINMFNGKPVNAALVDSLTEVFTENLDLASTDAFKKDIQEMVSGDKYSVNETTVKNITKNLKEAFAEVKFPSGFLNEVLPDESKITQILNENGLMGKNIRPVEFGSVTSVISDYIDTKFKEVFMNYSDIEEDDIEFIKSRIAGKKQKIHPINSALYKMNSSVFDTSLQENLKHLAKLFDDMSAEGAVLDRYAVLKTGAAPETVIANYWSEVSRKDLFKMLGVSDAEFEKVKFDKNLSGDLLRGKIEKIVSDKSAYEKLMNTLAEKIAKINEQIKASDITTHILRNSDDKSKTAYEEAVERSFNKFADDMRAHGLSHTADSLIGKHGDPFGSAMNIQKAYVEERLLGVKSSFYRLINTLDFYRRVADKPNDLKPVAGQILSREIREELIELCKVICLDGHSSDHATKFYMLRNPDPNKTDFSPIEVKDGKVVNKYFGQANAGVTDIPGDKFFYQNAMTYMFDNQMDSQTVAILEKNSLKDEVSNYRRVVLEKLGGEHYFVKPNHKIRARQDVGSDLKFNLTGIAPNEWFFKSGQQVYNTKKWLKIFGGFGAGLLGVTVLAQFFLGKIKPPKKAGEK